MNINELIKRLQQLKDSGFGDLSVEIRNEAGDLDHLECVYVDKTDDPVVVKFLNYEPDPDLQR